MTTELKIFLTDVCSLSVRPTYRNGVLTFGCFGIIGFTDHPQMESVKSHIAARNFPVRQAIFQLQKGSTGLTVFDDQEINFDGKFTAEVAGATYCSGLMVNKCICACNTESGDLISSC